MRNCWRVGTLAISALLADQCLAPAAEYTWDGTSANWDTAHWGGGAPYANSNDVGNVDNGGPYVTSGSTFLGRLNINSNGILRLGQSGAATGTTREMYLNGGTIAQHLDLTLAGSLIVTAHSYLNNAGGGGSMISSVLTGAGDLEKIGSGTFNIGWNASGYLGRFLLSQGRVYVRLGVDMGAIPVILGTNTEFNLRRDMAWTLRNDLAGSGKITTGETAAQSLTLQGACLRPGDTAAGCGTGILTMEGVSPTQNANLTLATDGTEPCQLVIDVTGGGGVAGTDYDQVKLTKGSLSGLANVALIVNFARSVKSPDLEGDVLTILACANDLSAQRFRSISLTEDWRASVSYSNGSVTLTNVYKVTRGTVVTFR